MDKKLLIAKALGIHGEHYERWSKFEPQSRSDEDNRFYLEGPIVGSEMSDFFGDADGFTTPAMLRKFLAENKGKDIEIYINSPGGSVFDGLAMANEAMRHDGGVHVIVTGACMSAATMFLTLPKAYRTAMPGCQIMIHEAWTMAMGNSKELGKVVAQLEKTNAQMADRYEAVSGFTKLQLLGMMEDETFFTEAEALDAGFVDEVYAADTEEDEDATENSIDASIDSESEMAIKSAGRSITSALALLI